MTRVLLTGASGYIGRPVHDALLARGFDVHATSRQNESCGNDATWHNVDVLDTSATADLIGDISPTHLIHLAWITEPGAYWQSDENKRWQEASIDLVDNFVAHGGERAVLVGTCAEYDLSGGHCIEGETPLKALSAYTAAKLAFRDAAIKLAETTSLEIAWARIFFSFGPHERPERLVPDVILALLNGRRAACTDGEQIRDFMYVDDLAAAIVEVLGSNFCGDINIASGNAMTIKELVTLIANNMNATDRVDFGVRERQAGEAPRITADVTRLQRDVGWNTKRNIESAIQETIAWWKQQGNIT